MNPFSIACLLVFVSSLACAVFIFWRPLNLLRFLWGLISVIVAAIGINLYLMMTAQSPVAAYSHAFALNFICILIPALFFHFTCILTGVRERKRTEILVYYAATLGYLGAVLAFPDRFVAGVAPLFELRYSAQAGPFYYGLPLLFFYLVAYGLILVARHYLRATEIKRNQLKYFLIGCSFGMVGGLNAFLPPFGVRMRPWGLCLLPLYVWIVSYAIVKHQLMDIKIVLRKSLIYSLLISLLTLAFFIFIYLLERIFHHIVGYTSLIGSVAAFTLIGVITVPIYRFLQTAIDRIFYKGTVSQIAKENTRLQKEMMVLESSRNLREIAHRIVEEIEDPLKRIKDQSYKRAIEGDIDYVRKIVAELREYSETVPKNYTEVNLMEVLDRKVDETSKPVAKRIFKYYQPIKPVKIWGSQAQLGRCFECLLNYCVAAIEKEGEIFIAMEYNKPWVSISLRHSGHSLSAEEAEGIFKPFFRSSKIAGGLSMALAQEIITQHGGKISLDAQEDSGVDFLIDLPII